MALISARLTRARNLYSVDSNQYTDANALIDINSLIREAILMRKTNWDIWVSNLVNGQDEYRVTELIGTPDVDIINVDKLFINYGSKLVKATPISYYEVDEDTTGSVMNPLYYSNDNSVFIIPTPEADVTSGVKIHARYTPGDIALTDDDSVIKLPSQIVDVIFEEGLAYYVEMSKKNYSDAKNLQWAYKQRLSKVNAMISDKIREPRPNNLPQDITTLI